MGYGCRSCGYSGAGSKYAGAGAAGGIATAYSAQQGCRGGAGMRSLAYASASYDLSLIAGGSVSQGGSRVGGHVAYLSAVEPTSSQQMIPMYTSAANAGLMLYGAPLLYGVSSGAGAKSAQYAPLFIADDFMAGTGRPGLQALPHHGPLRPLLDDAFSALSGQQLPDNILVTILATLEFRQLQLVVGGRANDGVLGLSFNGNGAADSADAGSALGLGSAAGRVMTSEIVLQKAMLARMLVVAGHELGHVLSPTLDDPVQEEAKAFAFTFAWARILVERNVGGVRTEVRIPEPAMNGLHDAAFIKVLRQLADTVTGKDAWGLYREMAHGN